MPEPKRFRKKDKGEVEAVQWTGENREEVEAFADGATVKADRVRLWTGTALVGDWIVKDGDSAYFVRTPKTFEATYEPASASLQKDGGEGRAELDRAVAHFIILAGREKRRGGGWGGPMGGAYKVRAKLWTDAANYLRERLALLAATPSKDACACHFVPDEHKCEGCTFQPPAPEGSGDEDCSRPAPLTDEGLCPVCHRRPEDRGYVNVERQDDGVKLGAIACWHSAHSGTTKKQPAPEQCPRCGSKDPAKLAEACARDGVPTDNWHVESLEALGRGCEDCEDGIYYEGIEWAPCSNCFPKQPAPSWEWPAVVLYRPEGQEIPKSIAREPVDLTRPCFRRYVPAPDQKGGE